MKLLVEIDEETYKDIKKGKVYSSFRDVPHESVLAIANGTPIPDNATVCDIEQIRAEIEQLHYHPKLDFIKNDDVVDMALNVIDKYKGDKE